MWMIWAILGVGLPLAIVGFYSKWRNKQIDKYNEAQKQAADDGTATVA